MWAKKAGRLRVPAGGVAVWANVAGEVDVEVWAERARERGLLFRTGRIFFLDQKPRPHVRLGFARFDEGELAHAVDMLAGSLPRR